MSSAGVSLIDPASAALVVGGTCLASGLAVGWAHLRAAFRQAMDLALVQPCDEAANRAALARLICVIHRRGLFAADAPLPPDPALADAMSAYLRRGDMAALHKVTRVQRKAVLAQQRSAASAWQHMAELAPLAGLASTLYAIAGLPPGEGETLAAATATALARAVVSTLYGLLLAHLICLPLAAAITRRAVAEQAARARLLAWFDAQLPTAGPRDPGQWQPVLFEAQ